MTLRLLSILIICSLTVSCIREDRSECPCRLVIGFGDERVEPEVILSLYDGNTELESEKLTISDWPLGYETTVPYCIVTACGIQGLDNNIVDSRNVLITKGKDSDRIFLYHNTIDCRGESASDIAAFHKNWCTLVISAENYEADGKEYQLIISGDVCGFNMNSGMPVEGPFECEAEKTDSVPWTSTVDIPRQNSSDKLSLSIVNKSDGVSVKEYDLSLSLAENGFNWSKKDLDDIHIYLDYADLSISVSVTDWETGMETHIKI